MRKNSRKLPIIGIIVALVLLVGSGGAYLFIQRSGEIVKKGPTPITDHRELPSKKADTTVIATNLDAPWGMAWLPNGDILVTERFGNLRRIKDGELLPAPIAGVPQVFSGGQGGLLDVSVHPNFETNQLVYLSYAHGTEEANRLRVSRAVLSGNSLEESEVVFEVAQTKSGGGHFGSRFQWLPDGSLLLSVGDGGNPPTEYNGKLIRDYAQSLQAHFGKLIRINDDGTLPEDNPFLGRPDVLHEIFSYGHRNVQGITYDTAREQIIVSEHGSKGGDELNAPAPGQNFGWPLTTYSTEYDVAGTLISKKQSLPGMEDPLAVWTPSIAPSGVVAYTGERYPESQGHLFLAAMVLRSNKTIAAYMSSPAGAILEIKRDKTGQVLSQEKITVGEVRVRDVNQGPNGYLYVITDSTSRQNKAGAKAGQILRLNSF